jgi:PST family polysaccharide transporter
VDPPRPRAGAARRCPAREGEPGEGSDLTPADERDVRAEAEAEAFDPAAFVEPEGGLTDTVVRGAGLAGIGFVATQTLTLGAFLVLARLASPSDFGDYAAGTLLVNIGVLFTDSGMMAALIHRKDRIDEAASTATIATFVSGFGFSLMALALAPVIGLIFHSSRIGEIAAASSGMLLVRSMLIVPQSLLQRRFSFLRRVIVEPLGAVVFGIVAIILCADGMGAWGLVIGYYAAAVVDVIVSWGLLDWRPRLRQVSYAMWRELAGYGRYVLGAHAVLLGTQELPVLLVGRFSGTGALGQFGYGMRLSMTPVGLVIQAGSYVLFPAFARITDDRGRFRDAMLRSLRLLCALSFPLVILLIPLGVPAAVLLFGPVWREAGYATMVLTAGAVAGAVSAFASEVQKADGHPELLIKVCVVQFVCTLVASVALLPLGLLGVCAGISLGAIVSTFYSLRLVRSLNAVRRSEFARATIPSLLASLLMAAILTPLEFLVIEADTRGTVLGLLLVAAEALAGLAIYVAAMAALDRPTLGELRDLAGNAIRR